MRNKWKIAFLACIFFLIITTGLGFYYIVDEGVSLTHLRDSYEKQEQDLIQLQEIINEGSFQKKQIARLLKSKSYVDATDILADTVTLNTKTLIFKNGKLTRVN
jgi:uncharacterized membrane protein